MPKNDSNVRAPKGTTVSVARYISSVQSLRLPDEVLLKTKCHLLDSLAAIISGSQLKAGRLAIDFIKTQGGTPESTVWGQTYVPLQLMPLWLMGSQLMRMRQMIPTLKAVFTPGVPLFHQRWLWANDKPVRVRRY